MSGSVAVLEALRVLRRSESRWMLASGLLFHLPLLVVLGLSSGDHLYLQLAAPLNWLRDGIVLAEALWLVLIVYYLAHASLARDLETGSLTLLTHASLTPARILAGKGLGVAALGVALHGVAALGILAYTPILRLSHGALVGWYLAVWLGACLLIPDGLAAALVTRLGGRAYAVHRIASVARLAAPLVFAQLMLTPAARARGATALDVPLRLLGALLGEPVDWQALLSRPGLCLVLALGLEILVSLAWTAWLRRAGRRW